MREIGGQTILNRVIAPTSTPMLRSHPQRQWQSRSVCGVRPASGRRSRGGFSRPLTGILAALDWAAEQRSGIQWIVSTPGDCPFLPRDLVARLHRARGEQDAELAVAVSDERAHPVIGLWNVTLRDELRQALISEGVRKVDRWTARYRLAAVSWPTVPFDPFFNINTTDDLAEAERLVALGSHRRMRLRRKPDDSSYPRRSPPAIA